MTLKYNLVKLITSSKFEMIPLATNPGIIEPPESQQRKRLRMWISGCLLSDACSLAPKLVSHVTSAIFVSYLDLEHHFMNLIMFTNLHKILLQREVTSKRTTYSTSSPPAASETDEKPRRTPPATFSTYEMLLVTWLRTPGHITLARYCAPRIFRGTSNTSPALCTDCSFPKMCS